MANQLTRLQIKNFRSLADVSIDIRPINVFFGPNGSGKSTLLKQCGWLEIVFPETLLKLVGRGITVLACYDRALMERNTYQLHWIQFFPGMYSY